MSKIGRITGHGLGVFFILLGAGFVVASVSGGAEWLDANSTCTYGDNCSDSAQGVFLFLGITFIVAGVFTSLVTEFAIRKTQRLFVNVSKLSTGDAAAVEGLADFLEPFGIDLDAARAAGADVHVQNGVLDLRGQRQGAVPTDPAGLNEYLKGFGINLGEQSLRNATVVTAGEPPAQAPAVFTAPGPPTASSESPRERESARIIRKKDRGETAGGQWLVEFELEVQPVGRVPYRVEVASLVRESLVSLLIEGSTLNVRVDPANRNSVTIDWSEN